MREFNLVKKADMETLLPDSRYCSLHVIQVLQKMNAAFGTKKNIPVFSHKEMIQQESH